MAYATISAIQTLYGAAFLEDITPLDVPDPDAAINSALRSASAEIDGYLSARYTLPLAGSPEVLERPCIDLGVYILANSHARLTETIENRAKEARSFLAKLAEGKAGLGKDEPEAKIDGADQASASGAAFSAQPRKFGRGRS